MEIDKASKAFSALGHKPRLEVFRLLVRAGRAGMAAGEIGRALGFVQNTLSSYLAILTAAELVLARREGRSIVYAAAFDALGELLGFLVDECCDGAPDLCGAALARLGGATKRSS